MTTTFTTRLDAPDASTSALLRTILVSVPTRFRLTNEPRADVVLMSGVQADWTRRLDAAIAAGMRGILVVRPGWADGTELRHLSGRAAATHTVVGVDFGFASGRSWKTALPQIKADAPTATLLDSVLTFDSVPWVTALVEQLATVRGILPALEPLEVAHLSDDQYVVSGQAAHVAVALAGLRSPLSEYALNLNLVGLQQRWRVQMSGDGPARPSEILRFDSAGAHAQPALYESPHRAALLDLHTAMSDGTPCTFTLADLADCLDMAAAIRSSPKGHVLL